MASVTVVETPVVTVSNKPNGAASQSIATGSILSFIGFFAVAAAFL